MVHPEREDAVKTILSLHSKRQGVPQNITPRARDVLHSALAHMGRQNNGEFLVIQRLQITDNTDRLCHKSKYYVTVLLNGLTYCFLPTNSLSIIDDLN